MTKERLEQIKENVHVRCSIANITGIGMTAPDREEDELIDEIERLNYIINELEKESYLGMIENQNKNDYAKGLYTAYKYINDKLQELKRK